MLANQGIFPNCRWKGDFNALIDIGTGDNFYKQGQLLPENLEKAAKEAGVKGLEIRYQPVSPPLPTPLYTPTHDARSP